MSEGPSPEAQAAPEGGSPRPEAPPSIDGVSPPYTAPYPPYPSDLPSAPGLAPNLAAALAYLTVFPAIVLLIVEPYRSNALVRFHSWQSVFYFVAVAAVQVVAEMLLAVLPVAPAHALAGLLSLILFALWLVAVIKALQAELWQLPAVGRYAARMSAAGQSR